jgi:hypothetical protein
MLLPGVKFIKSLEYGVVSMCVSFTLSRSMCVTIDGVLDNWILVTGFIDHL